MAHLYVDDVLVEKHADAVIPAVAYQNLYPNAKTIAIYPSQDEGFAVIRAAHAQMMTAAVGNASEIERDTWPLQLQAALAIKAGTATASQQKMAADMLVPSETISLWVNKVIAKNEAMQSLIGTAQGIKRRAEKAVETAADSIAIAAALDVAKQEAEAAMQQFAPK